MKKTYRAAALMLAPISLSAIAQDNGEALDEVVSWGTAISSSSVFVGERDIAIKQADHMSDLLRSIPGVDIGGTHSVNTRINIRGLDDRDLSVYIDGVLQTNYLYHHVGNLLINPDILKSADIELGANTVVNGGLGGALRFETKDAQDLLEAGDRIEGRAYLSSHSNEQQAASFTLYGLLGQNADYLVYYNNTDRDNFEDGSGQETIGSDGETDNLLVKGGLNLDENQRLEFSAEFYEDRGDYGQRPDMGFRAAQGLAGGLAIPLFDTEYDRDTINLSYEGIFDWVQLDANIYTNETRFYRDESAGIVSPFGALIPSTEKEVVADNFGFTVLATTEFDSHRLNYGVEYFDQDFDYDSDLNSSDDPRETQNAQTLGVFIEDRISLTDKFALTPGVRLNQYDMEIDLTNIDEDFRETTWALAADYRVTQNLELLASFTQLFKGPELAEPFQGTGGVLLPNGDLEPETGENIEVGLRFSQDIGDSATFKFGFNVFETRIDDYITIEGRATQRYVNSGTAKIEGFEASANYSVGIFDTLLSYARSDLNGDNLEADDTTESLREIGDSITFDVNAKISERLTANYNMLNIRKKTREFAGADKPGYTVHNISVLYEPEWFDGATFVAGVDNLFDKEYTSHASREGLAPFTNPPTLLDDVEPGRNVKVSVSYEF